MIDAAGRGFGRFEFAVGDFGPHDETSARANTNTAARPRAATGSVGVIKVRRRRGMALAE